MDYNIPTIFNNNFTITQFFGQNDVVDYTRFGMIGHNGVDFVPWAGESWEIGAVMDGFVDLSVDPLIMGATASNNTLYFDADKIHLNNVGYKRVADIAQPVITSLLAS